MQVFLEVVKHSQWILNIVVVPKKGDKILLIMIIIKMIKKKLMRTLRWKINVRIKQ
jgi:hypothetical protein